MVIVFVDGNRFPTTYLFYCRFVLSEFQPLSFSVFEVVILVVVALAHHDVVVSTV